MGAAAALGALPLGRSQDSSPSQVYYYQDSFGNIAPVDQTLINLGIYPPPVPATSALPGNAANPGPVPEADATTYSSGYPKYNILLIIVDQMRNPALWLPSGNNWWSAYNSVLPNITGLAKKSAFIFPNYFVAATACTPSRACLLTGLYSQQTCIFSSSTDSSSVTSPPLLPYNPGWSSGNYWAGFPTIGNVLSQQLNANNGYDCAWIGKWHLSCYDLLETGPGANGPSDYGFGDPYCLPNANNSNPYHTLLSTETPVAYPSPNGVLNGGAGGDFLDAPLASGSNGHDIPNFLYGDAYPVQYYNNNTGTMQPVMPVSDHTQLSDAAIAYAFTDGWLPFANSTFNTGGGYPSSSALNNPWFCAVSFINPHDITDFPYASGLLPTPGNFTLPANNGGLSPTGYQPPPMNNSSNMTYYGSACYGGSGSCATDVDEVLMLQFPNLYAGLPPGLGNNSGPWNYETLSPYGTTGGKPDLQLYFQVATNHGDGIIQTPSYNNSTSSWSDSQAWITFLNYYVWLQSCVDYQVGQVLTSLYASPFNNNTIIIFTSDHGDYGGSHGLHTKAGALYEESINVPLIISYPGARHYSNNSSSPITLPYVCSSVDLLPYLYSTALGNDGWRSNNNDMVYYLAGRESISDAIYAYGAYMGYTGIIQQRRISGISLNSTFGSNNWQMYQPFVLHTTDEYLSANVGNSTSNNYQPSHAIAFRTVDQTEVNTESAPFYPQSSYGGGKLGVYTFWNTSYVANNDAPIVGIFNNSIAAVQYEFYNYSPSRGNANPQELGNQALDGSGNISTLALPYVGDFFNINNNNGINVPGELYGLYNSASPSNNGSIPQVQAAIQSAFNNYISYLVCTDQMTGNNGQPVSSNNYCGDYSW